MTRISKYKIPDKELLSITNHFTDIISSIDSKTEAEHFFQEFFTYEEKIMLAKRLVLFMMIKKDYSPTTIQSALHVSYETVRTYTNQFTHKDEAFKKIIDKLLTKEQTKEFWKKIEAVLKPLGILMKSRNDMKSRAKFASGDWS